MSSKIWVLIAVASGLVVALIVTVLVMIQPSAPQIALPSPVATTTHTAPPTPAATATPTSPPMEQELPTLDELVLTEHGLADLAIGVDPASLNPATALVEERAWDCEGTGESGTAWYPVLEDDGEHYPYSVLVPDTGVISSITVSSPRISTDRGARTGMAWADIAPLYPEAVDTSAGGNGSVHAFATDSGSMFFMSFDGVVGTIGLGSLSPDKYLYKNNHGLYAFCL